MVKIMAHGHASLNASLKNKQKMRLTLFQQTLEKFE